MTAKTSGRTLPEKLLTYMSRKPHRRYSANEFTRIFRIPTGMALDALGQLCQDGKVLAVPMPPQGMVYCISTQAPRRYVPTLRELNGWETGLRGRMALCELTRTK